jgi:Uma2 family endonuclease
MNYQSINSMSAYVLVDQFRTAVTVYRRDASDAWEMEFLGATDGILRLPEIDCALPMRGIYERVLPPE